MSSEATGWWQRGAVLAAVFVLGVVVAWMAMATGAWLGNDSLTYVGVARNIDDGRGLTSPFAHELSGLAPDDQVARLGREPLTAWPPAYPVALASATPLGVSPESMARLLGALCLGLTMGATALFVFRLGGGLVTAGLMPVLFAASLATILTFTNLASEPLYVVLQSGALLVLLSLLRRCSWQRIGAFVALSAAAILTRYVGIAVLVTGAVAIGVAVPAPLRRRVLVAFGVVVAGFAPLALWLVEVRRSGEASPGIAYTSRFGELGDPARAVGEWLVPHRNLTGGWVIVTAVVFMAIVIKATAGYLVAHRRAIAASLDGEPGGSETMTSTSTSALTEDPLPAVLVLVGHASLYAMIVFVAASFVDHEIPIGGRLVLPLAPSLLALIGAGIEWLIRLMPFGDRVRQVSVIMATLFVVVAIVAGGRYTYDAVYAQPLAGVWTPPVSSPAIDVLRAYDRSVLIFTNQPSALYAATGREVLALPLARSKQTGKVNPDLDRYLDQVAGWMRTRPTVVAIRKADREPFDVEAALASRLPIGVVHDDDEYRILQTCERPVVPDAPCSVGS